MMEVFMSDDRLGYWHWSVVHCLRVFRHINSRLMDGKLVVVVVVMVVVMVVVVVKVSDDYLGSWYWSIIHSLSVFCHKKTQN